jgi:hypothetical protein
MIVEAAHDLTTAGDSVFEIIMTPVSRSPLKIGIALTLRSHISFLASFFFDLSDPLSSELASLSLSRLCFFFLGLGSSSLSDEKKIILGPLPSISLASNSFISSLISSCSDSVGTTPAFSFVFSFSIFDFVLISSPS